MEHRIVNEINRDGLVRLEVLNGDGIDFVYEVQNRAHPMPHHDVSDTALEQMSEEDTFHRAEVHLMEGGQDYCIMGWSRDQVAMDVMNQYSQHVQFVESMR